MMQAAHLDHAVVQTRKGRRRLGAAVVCIAVALVLPLLARNFLLFQLTMLMVYGLAIIGLNLLTGFNGQFSLGHGAFYALGAYTTAVLMNSTNLNYALTVPAAAAICFLAGCVFGLPALRLERIYLALATFALALAAPQLLKMSPLNPWTGGAQGIVLLKPEAPWGLKLSSDQWMYYFCLAVTLLLYLAAERFVASRSGRAIMAIRDNPIAASAMGVNVALHKTMTFGLSAMYTGVAGSLGAMVIAFVSPDSFGFGLSVALLVGLVVGGTGWLPGALIGASFVLFVPNFAEHISKGLSGAAYGAILLLVIHLMPSGMAGLIEHAKQAVMRLRARNRPQ